MNHLNTQKLLSLWVVLDETPKSFKQTSKYRRVLLNGTSSSKWNVHITSSMRTWSIYLLSTVADFFTAKHMQDLLPKRDSKITLNVNIATIID